MILYGSACSAARIPTAANVYQCISHGHGEAAAAEHPVPQSSPQADTTRASSQPVKVICALIDTPQSAEQSASGLKTCKTSGWPPLVKDETSIPCATGTGIMLQLSSPTPKNRPCEIPLIASSCFSESTPCPPIPIGAELTLRRGVRHVHVLIVIHAAPPAQLPDSIWKPGVR